MSNFFCGLFVALIVSFMVWQALLSANETARIYQECGGVYCAAEEK